MGTNHYKAYKAELILPVNTQKVSDWLLNIPGHCRWVYRCIKSSKLFDYKPNHFIIHYIIDVPFPVADREVFFDTQYTEKIINQQKIVNIQMNVTDSDFKIQKSNVKIKQGSIQIILKEMNENSTQLIYIYDLDPAENLSKTLADPFHYRLTYYTMKNLFDQIR